MTAVSPLSDPHSSARSEQYWVGSVGLDTDLLGAQRKPCRGMIVGVAGTLVYKNVAGENKTIVTHSADLYLPIQATALVAAGSSAEDITVFW